MFGALNGCPLEMSRSIHTTRRGLADLKRQKFATDDERRKAIADAESDLWRKRRIKRKVHGERHLVAPAGERTPPGSIPINKRDDGPYVFHAADPSDVRAILEALPLSAVEGIEEVRLALGADYMEERVEDTRGTPDPYTGRLGSSLFPGVYAGTIFGTYFPSRGFISLYAYVVDWQRVPVPRAIVELYLRLQVLKTLAHEVAHFHDHAARVRRGRWLADRRENLEWYAEKMESEWTAQIVVPYLERRYAKECRAFRSWVSQRGGINLPLGFFSGDNRRTERNGMTRLVFSTAGAFESWLEAMPQCGSLQAARLALAWELHYSDKYEECLAVLNRILRDDSAHVASRACRSDTLVHLERLDEALEDADAVIAADPAQVHAWRSRANVLEERQDWNGLIQTCDRWEHERKLSPNKRRDCFRYRAVACCAIGDLDGMEASLATYWAAFRFKDPEAAKRRAHFVRKVVFRRAGRPIPG